MRGKLWCLDDSVRTSPKLVGSRAAEVSIYQKRSKEGTVVNQRQGQSLVLMHVGSEGFPVWSNPTDAAGSDRKVSVHNYLLCIGLHSCWRVRVMQDNAPCHKAKMTHEWFQNHTNDYEVLTWSPDYQSNWASVWWCWINKSNVWKSDLATSGCSKDLLHTFRGQVYRLGIFYNSKMWRITWSHSWFP